MVDDYKPPSALNIVFDFDDDIYIAPNSLNVVFVFDQESQTKDTYVQGIGIAGFHSGQHTIYGATKSITPIGFYSMFMGVPDTRRKLEFINLQGIQGGAFGRPNIINKNKLIFVNSFNASLYGQSLIYNLQQYILVRSINSFDYGNAYLQGGVKNLNIVGFNSERLGSAKIHRNEQYINLKDSSFGIAPPNLPYPSLSPRILYPTGILSTAFGNALVQRNPSPKGFINDKYGNAWVSHNPRYLNPIKIEAFQAGYPKVFDPTQRINHTGSPHISSGIFGDIAINNHRRIVLALGRDQSQYGDWSVVNSNLIKFSVRSIDSNAFGTLNNIRNKTPSIIPQSINNNVFGTTLISDRIRRITNSGIASLESQRFGKHTLTKTPEIKLDSISSQIFGDTWVSNKNRNITTFGLNALRFDDSTIVWFKQRHVSATGINSPDTSTPIIEHGLRTIFTNSELFNVFGLATVWFKVRSIQAPSIFKNFETNHFVGGSQYIQPQSFLASHFGNRIIPEIQVIYAQGFSSQNISEQHQIELHTRWVRTSGFSSFGQQALDRYGTARLWNKRQYIKHSYASDDGLNSGEFGHWSAIANKNRNIIVIGLNATKFGYHKLENNARLLRSNSFDASAFGKAMIADRVRQVYQDGMEAPYMSGWSRIFNTAHQIQVSGSQHELYGRPSVFKTRREYRWIGAFESMQFGQAMVAFRIRKINIENRYGINPPSIALPNVALLRRYIEPVGLVRDLYGNVSLHIKWNIITPRWTHREAFGGSLVRNLTPELKQHGVNSEEFGKPTLRLQWDRYLIEGFSNEIFGRANISFRNRKITSTGFNWSNFGRATVIKTGAPPYSLQTITLDWSGIGDRPTEYSGDGIKPPSIQVAYPSLKTNVIFTSGFSSDRFGFHKTQSNGILVYPGIQNFIVGNHVVTLKHRVIKVPTLGDLAEIINTNPRLSPYTIKQIESDNERVEFGRTHISLRHQKLYMLAYDELTVGSHKIELAKRYINVKGYSSFRNGWHLLFNNTPQQLIQFDSSDASLFGEALLTSPYYGPQTIHHQNSEFSLFGQNKIDFYNRAIRVSGFDAALLGSKVNSDTPYKPQGLWVGEPMPTLPNGFNAELFGKTWISLKVRDVSAKGFDAFVSEMDISNFKNRMKVILIKKPIIKESQEIKPQSFDASSYGVPNIRLAVHYIRPDGNSDQYRKGAPQ